MAAGEDGDFDPWRSALEYVLPYLAGTELEQAGAWFTVVWIDRPPPTLQQNARPDGLQEELRQRHAGEQLIQSW